MTLRFGIAILLMILNVLSYDIYAEPKNEKADTSFTGEISGSVKDTTLNYFLQAATIAVYNSSDSSLVAYSLTNASGEFHIRKLPIEKVLYLKVSYIGYSPYTFTFTISVNKKQIHFKEIYLEKCESLLEEVTVTNSPVRMHGDTLEFSAGAFALDKTAVAEDLLKVLPGVIVWGDGTITLNGRSISKLLVDGKPFFGGEYKIATQNIPKTAIDKVQVYQESIDPNNPLDSISSINLKLKAGHHAGYFGLISAGLGSSQRYGAGINTNLFNRKEQFAFVGQINNTNKLTNDIYSLLRNNTYKGTGVRVEYQPNFTMQGANQQSSGGFLYSHDYIPEYNDYNKDRIAIMSFINRTSNTTNREIHTVKSIGLDSSLHDHYLNQTHLEATGLNLEGRYSKKKNWDSLAIAGAYEYGNEQLQNAFKNETSDSKLNILNHAKLFAYDTSSTHKITLLGFYDHHGFLNSDVHRLTNWSIAYSLISETRSLNRLRRYNLNYSLNPASNQDFDRRFDDQASILKNSLSLNLGDFAAWLFPKTRFLSRLSIQFVNDFSWNIKQSNDLVTDLDIQSNSYRQNSYMSRLTQYSDSRLMTGIKLGKLISYGLANRYQKDLSIYLNTRMQFYAEKYISSQPVQNYTNSYQNFIPTIDLSYINYQYGEYVNRYGLNFGVNYEYPTSVQRSAITDSTEIFFIQKENPLLVPAQKYELTLRYGHQSYRLKNAISYGASIFAGIVNNFIGDSIITDKAGRLVYYPVNVKGRKHIGGNIYINKALLLGNHQIQLNFTGFIRKVFSPGFLGYESNSTSGPNLEKIILITDSFSINYSYKNKLAINLLHNILYYQSTQVGFSNAKFINKQISTKLGIALNPAKRIAINSNASLNTFPNIYSNTKSQLIWNTSIALRLLKYENLELKLSALDLLHQNKGIINYANNYSYSHGEVNTLQQYFSIDVSFFPRKFNNTNSTKKKSNEK